MCAIIITPLVSVAYLIIFLKIEPHAFHHFKKMFYLDVFFQATAAAKNPLDSVDRLRPINGSIARDTQSTVHHHDTHQISIDSDASLTSISINSRESSLVDADERRKSSFNSNPSLYMFDFIRDSLLNRPSVVDDRSEVELSCILENMPLNAVSNQTASNSADITINTTINSNFHDVGIF
jgi:hypothetical protein